MTKLIAVLVGAFIGISTGLLVEAFNDARDATIAVDAMSARLSRLVADSASCAWLRFSDSLWRESITPRRDSCRWFISEISEWRMVPCGHGSDTNGAWKVQYVDSCSRIVIVRDSIYHCEGGGK